MARCFPLAKGVLGVARRRAYARAPGSEGVVGRVRKCIASTVLRLKLSNLFFCSGTILGPGVGKFADGIGQNVCFENYYYMSLNMDIHLSAAAVTEVEMKFGDAICVRLWHEFPTPTVALNTVKKKNSKP